MPPTRIVKGTFAAATAALVLLPMGAASASAPSAATPTAPSRQDATPSQPDAADRAAPCADRTQIGKTTYIRRGGETIASVRHFFSRKCNRSYGYIWVWQGYLDKHHHYKTCVGLWDGKRLLGNHCRNNERELWSYPVTPKRGLAARGSVTEYKAVEYKSSPRAAQH